MTPKQLAKELCKSEGLKKQVDIAQMSEIVGRLADLFYADSIHYADTVLGLMKLGEKRAKKKKKAC